MSCSTIDREELNDTERDGGLFSSLGGWQQNPIYSKYHLSNLEGGATVKQASPKRLTAL